MALKVRTVGGEGKSAREALRALASGLKNEEVDEDQVLVIHIVRSAIRALGDHPGYEGFLATVTSAPAPHQGSV